LNEKIFSAIFKKDIIFSWLNAIVQQKSSKQQTFDQLSTKLGFIGVFVSKCLDVLISTISSLDCEKLWDWHDGKDERWN
jgi:hypothetical protein